MKLCVVSATTNLERAMKCFESWGNVALVIVCNGPAHPPSPIFDNGTLIIHQDYLGTVPAFRAGVDYALDHTDADVIAALHDDLEIFDPDWIAKTIRLFERHPQCGLAGFGGAIGLGSDDLYIKPYDPMQLARIGFRSNLVDAEVHGIRSLLSERVACCDGFSLIGRRGFFKGQQNPHVLTRQPIYARPWTYFESNGIIHHAYDSLFGAYAKRLGWEVWYLPINARHYGGRTAVGDPGYQAWAKDQIIDGDHGFWVNSHRLGYELFRDQLPIRV